MINNKWHVNSVTLLVSGIALFLTACSSYEIEAVQETETAIQSDKKQQKIDEKMKTNRSLSKTIEKTSLRSMFQDSAGVSK